MDMAKIEQCTVPQSDARDCPVHKQDVTKTVSKVMNRSYVAEGIPEFNQAVSELREVNAVYIAKLRELYDYFVTLADENHESTDRPGYNMRMAAEITEILDKVGAL